MADQLNLRISGIILEGAYENLNGYWDPNESVADAFSKNMNFCKKGWQTLRYESV